MIVFEQLLNICNPYFGSFFSLQIFKSCSNGFSLYLVVDGFSLQSILSASSPHPATAEVTSDHVIMGSEGAESAELGMAGVEGQRQVT